MRDFLAWAWKDFRKDLERLDAGKLMGGLIIYPVFLGIAYEIGSALAPA